eukprot:2552104-Prymnesium_polylepis.1
MSCQGEHRGREFVIAQCARVVRVVLLQQRLRLFGRDPYTQLIAEREKLVHVQPVGRVVVKLVEHLLEDLSLVAAAFEERVDDSSLELRDLLARHEGHIAPLARHRRAEGVVCREAAELAGVELLEFVERDALAVAARGRNTLHLHYQLLERLSFRDLAAGHARVAAAVEAPA